MTNPHMPQVAKSVGPGSPGSLHQTSLLHLGICMLAATAFAFAIPLNHDVAWMLTAAEQMRDGNALYRDILDINPPLIFWFARGIVGLSDLSGLSPESVYLLFVLLLIGLVARSMGRQALLLVAVATIAVGRDFGEREHLIVLLALPAVLGRGTWWAGLGLGLAIALKPFYLPLWAVSLLLRRRWAAADWVVLSTGVTYLAAVILWSPDFLTLARAAGDAYARWRSIGPLELLMRPAVLFAVLVGVIVARMRDERAHALALAALAGVLALLVQGKGFPYHAYPALAFALLSAGSLWPRTRWLLPMAVAVVLWPYVDPDTRYWRAWQRQSASGLELPAGTSVLVISRYISAGFPAARDRKLEWVGRYPHVWWADDPRTNDFGTAHLRADLQRGPDIVAVERGLLAYADTAIGAALARDFDAPDTTGYFWRYRRRHGDF